jgi:uncharacterized protein (DUF885 family)
LDRRAFLALGASASALGFSGVPALAAAGEAAKARALYDRIMDRILDVSPMTATGLGLDVGKRAAERSMIDDRTHANRLQTLRPLAEAVEPLKGINPDKLQGRDRSDFETVKWVAGISAEIGQYPFGGVDSYGYPVPYVLSQLTGIYSAVPDFLDTQHPIETKADADAYLARLDAFAREIDHDTERAKADVATGVLPPDFVCDKTLSQLKDLRGSRLMASNLGKRAAEKQIAGDWEARANALLNAEVGPALDRQMALVAQMRARTTHEAGVRGRVPAGSAYYAMCLNFQTSTSMSPDEAHELGLSQVDELSSAADVLLKAEGLTQGPVGARMKALGEDPKWLYPNTEAGRAQLLADLNGQVEAMRARLPEVFAHLPKTPVEVRRVPPAIELGAPNGYSQSGSLDGTRPGAYYINLKDTAIWPKWSLPTLTYHESLPGHHLQGTLALESQGTPLLLKNLGFNAYNEGWALYAEQLGDELGMYRALPTGRIGYLQSFLFRAVRIVVDTGMHWKGWSREKAADYMAEITGRAMGAVNSEIDRYVVWPGQACGYKIGHLEFVRLREAARAKLGGRFDIRGFHDAVLLGGAMPLEVLGRVVDGWVASRA